MRANHTLTQLQAGQPAVGLWLTSHSPQIARLIAAQGLFDWLLVDMEHSPLDYATAAGMVAGIADISGGACSPIVRLANGTIDQIKHALDAGAHGVIVPMVNTAQDAANAVRYSRYPPMGERGAGGLLPHLTFGAANHVDYIRDANTHIMVSVQIETGMAVENIDAIVDVPGLDMIFIGPFDLHISLGLPPGLWSDAPVFQDAFHKVKAACARRGLPLGTLAPNAEGASARFADGFTFVGMGTDMNHMVAALHAQAGQLRKTP